MAEISYQASLPQGVVIKQVSWLHSTVTVPKRAVACQSLFTHPTIEPKAGSYSNQMGRDQSMFSIHAWGQSTQQFFREIPGRTFHCNLPGLIEQNDPILII